MTSPESIVAAYRAGTIDRALALAELLPLVHAVARALYRRLRGSVELEELVQDGVFGLSECLDRFDADRELTFATFAGWRIRGAMLDAIRERDWVPRKERERGNGGPRFDSLSRRVHAGESRDLSLQDVLTAPPRSRPGCETLTPYLAGLSRAEKLIVTLYYAESLSMREIGRAIGYSESRVSQTHTSIIKRLKARILCR